MKKLTICIFLGILCAQEGDLPAQDAQNAQNENEVAEVSIDTTPRYTFGLSLYSGITTKKYTYIRVSDSANGSGFTKSETPTHTTKIRTDFGSSFTIGRFSPITENTSWDINFSIMGLSTRGFLAESNYYYSPIDFGFANFGFFGGAQGAYRVYAPRPAEELNKFAEFVGHKFIVGPRLGFVLSSRNNFYLKLGYGYDFGFAREISDDVDNYAKEFTKTGAAFIQYIVIR
ncbi:MAG: hypothetical protein E7K04_05550 [Helicobacter sp.]|nr:hypothetical protein [Helicobacter sp.]